jgi:hypothetical protein
MSISAIVNMMPVITTHSATGANPKDLIFVLLAETNTLKKDYEFFDHVTQLCVTIMIT